ncbi:MAG: hypothetical protein ACK4YU_14400, partial [Paracoccus sp. (in: a-proteobacteria)]
QGRRRKDRESGQGLMPTWPKIVELRTAGVLGGDVAGETRVAAMRHGVRLSGLCGNVWPANDDGLHRLVADAIVRELTDFSLYARRYMELMGVKEGVVSDGPLISIKDDGKFEKDVWTAVNRILHAARLDAQFATSEPEKHDHLGDLHFVQVKVTSKQMATVNVCPQGLFYGFMRDDLSVRAKEGG